MKKKLINKKNFSFFIFIKPLIFSILFILLISFIYDFYKNDNFKKKIIILVENFSINYEYLLTDISVNKLEYIEVDDIRSLFSKYENKSIFLVPIEEISNQLLKNSWINSIKINNDYHNSIKIIIQESIPTGLYLDQNKYHLFDLNGKKLKFIKGNKIEKLDLIKFEGGQVINNAIKLIKILPYSFKKEINRAIYINDRRWNLILDNNILLKLPENNIMKSINNYNKIYKNISFNELEKIKYIDLRINNKIILKFKELSND